MQTGRDFLETYLW